MPGVGESQRGCRQVTLKLGWSQREREGGFANAKTENWERPSSFREQEMLLKAGGREKGKCSRN